MTDPLIEKARNEVGAIRRTLASLIPPNDPITILLYQPPTGEHTGRFIDVGPRPDGVTSDIEVFQSINSGASGAALTDPQFSLRFTPIRKKISKSDVATYKENNPLELRERQVQLEKIRHSNNIKWPEAHATPLGSFIHHLSISPSVRDLYDPRVPTYGYVYTITTHGDNNSNEVQKLIQAAQVWMHPFGAPGTSQH